MLGERRHLQVNSFRSSEYLICTRKLLVRHLSHCNSTYTIRNFHGIRSGLWLLRRELKNVTTREMENTAADLK